MQSLSRGRDSAALEPVARKTRSLKTHGFQKFLHGEIPNFPDPLYGFKSLLYFSEPRKGFEPPTHALQKRCSTAELPRHFARGLCVNLFALKIFIGGRQLVFIFYVFI